MYYSYKSKKGNKRKYKLIVFLIILTVGTYFGYRYKHHLFFWKYTYNKLNLSLLETGKISRNETRREHLVTLLKIANEYIDDNQTSSDAYSLRARIHYEIALTYQNGTFSDLIINDALHDIDKSSKNEFIKAISDFKKEMALAHNKEVSPENSLMLAMSCFYSDFYQISEIHNLVQHIDEYDTISDINQIRFCAIIKILNGSTDQGLSILKKHDTSTNNLKRRLFLASAYNITKRYTNSIIEYKFVLKNSDDDRIIKLVNMRLGKIYYNQSLYKESLYHFNDALKFDNSDNTLKIWIGRNYSALGKKTRAKAIWNEVLVSDQDNMEVKKLLGLM